jgi:hypothetical protein
VLISREPDTDPLDGWKKPEEWQIAKYSVAEKRLV